MRIISFFLLLCFFGVSVFGQSWQKEFQMSDQPQFFKETEDGIIEVHYTDEYFQDYKLLVSSTGDSIGIEYYNEPLLPNPYFQLLLDSTNNIGDSLAYFDSDTTLLWKVDIEDVFQPYFFKLPNFAIIKRVESYNTTRKVEAWVYNRMGDLVFKEFFEGPNSVNSIHIFEAQNKLHLVSSSRTPTLPQGAGQNILTWKVMDSMGISCEQFAIDNYLGETKSIAGVAINGQGNCGSIGYYFDREFGRDGQYLPCTGFVIPQEDAIPTNGGMIGLQGDAYAILGIRDNTTILTRMDCLFPYEDLCLYTPEDSYHHQIICQGRYGLY